MRKGFTLIETLVVATIVTVIAVASLAGFSAFRNKQALKGGLDEIRAAVEATKRRSVAQDQGSRWGVRFTNATSGVSSYSTFKGSSYSTSGVDRLYSFRGALGFGNPSASSTYDVVFSPLSGALSENKVLTIVSGRAGLIGDLILRTIGSLTARQDHDVVGYWHFDEGTSTLAYDASGNDKNGTFAGSPSWVTGRADNAVNCGNTTSDKISVSVDLSSEWTIEAW
ncbi:MAG: type II secretion system protein, partial [Candidatus Jorgensenbacteria bacterium]|nr:type II secretion system protein [Candidatus Jorgensenbacteria bacterium]